jgi:hypothetical protein
MKERRFLIVLALGFGLLAACQPVTAGVLVNTGGESDQKNQSLGSAPAAPQGLPGSHYSYSGDDAYDPAAGGLSIKQSPANLAKEQPVRQSGGYSGDDAYDPAAGGLSIGQKPANLAKEQPVRQSGGYSGDDAYDPAAGGLGFYK